MHKSGILCATCALLWSGVTHQAAAAQLSIQLSDPKGIPLRGAQITLTVPSSLAMTDVAGKATIEYQPVAGPVAFKIVRPPGLVVISPWQGNTSVPPNIQTIVVATREQMARLEDPPVVKAAVAKVNVLQRPRSETGHPESDAPPEYYLKRAASDLGVDPVKLGELLQRLQKSGSEPYLRGMASLYERDYDQAAAQLAEALKQAEGQTPTNSREVSNAAAFLGQAQFKRGDFSAAAAAYLTASRARPDDPVLLNNLGISLSRAGRYGEAKPVYQRAIDILRRQPDADPLDVQTANSNLAALYVYAGDFASAEPVLRRAVTIGESVSPKDPMVANAMNNLAAILLAQQKCAEARPLLEKAVQIQREASKESGSGRSINSKDLAGLETEIRRPMQRDLVMSKEGIGAGTAGLNTILLNLASLLLCEGKPAAARDLLEETVAQQKAQLGALHPEVASSLNILANARAQAGNSREAMLAIVEALSIQKVRLGDAHPALALSEINLADLLVKSGAVDEAKDLYRQAEVILVKTFGEQGVPVLKVREKLAKVTAPQR